MCSDYLLPVAAERTLPYRQGLLGWLAGAALVTASQTARAKCGG